MDSFFVRGVGFDFSALERAESASLFDVFGFFNGLVGDFDFVDGVFFSAFFVFVLFLVVFVECSAASDSVGRSMRLHFILLRFDDAGSESSDFVFAQRRFGSSFVACFAAFELVSFFAVGSRGSRAFE